MPRDVTGLLLAGGRSRRFGTDKAAALVGGRPMIARVYAALAPLAAEVLVSVDRPGRRYALPGPARTVADTAPGAGPLAGLVAGLRAATTPWLLVAACDLPLLSAEALAPLLAARHGPLDAVVAVTPDGRRQPLCAVYHRRVLPVAEAQLAAGVLAMQALLDRLAVRTVEVPAETLHNVNAPADLPAYHAPRS